MIFLCIFIRSNRLYVVSSNVPYIIKQHSFFLLSFFPQKPYCYASILRLASACLWKRIHIHKICTMQNKKPVKAIKYDFGVDYFKFMPERGGLLRYRFAYEWMLVHFQNKISLYSPVNCIFITFISYITHWICNW